MEIGDWSAKLCFNCFTLRLMIYEITSKTHTKVDFAVISKTEVHKINQHKMDKEDYEKRKKEIFSDPTDKLFEKNIQSEEKDCDLCEYFGVRQYWDYRDDFRQALFCKLKEQDIDGTITTAKKCDGFKRRKLEPDKNITQKFLKATKALINEEKIVLIKNILTDLKEKMDYIDGMYHKLVPIDKIKELYSETKEKLEKEGRELEGK